MKPLIFDYKTERIAESIPVIYHYDSQSSMNVVALPHGNKYFIEIKGSDLEFETKTRVHKENDDDSFLHYLDTETKVFRETTTDRTNTLLELQTKTFVTRERDDERSAYNQ